MEATKQVIFQLGREEYGFDIMLVNAIEDYKGVVPVPNAPNYILGILYLRGEVIPVYSLRVKFGMSEEENSAQQLIVTKSNGVMVGFKVDSVKEIAEISQNQLHSMPVILRNEATQYARAAANINSKMVILLDHNGILSQEEQSAVEQLAKEHKN